MSITDFLRNLFRRKAVNPLIATEFGSYQSSWLGVGSDDNNYDKQVKTYKSWVYRCASLNATSVAQQKLKLYVRRPQKSRSVARVDFTPVSAKTYECYLRNPVLSHYIKKDVEIEEITEHPFLELMRNVNPQRNEFDLKNETELFLELTGNGYWLLIPSNIRGASGLRIPAEIWVLPSQRVKIIPDSKEFVKGYEYKVGMRRQMFSPGEVIHFRFPNPHSLLYGLSPVMGASYAIDMNIYMKEYEINLFKNQARPDYLIMAKSGMSEAGRKRFEKAWLKKFRGTRKAGQAAVLEGDVDIKELNFAPREMAFLQGAKMTREEIAFIFGVPMSKLTAENTNRATAQTQEYQYAKDTILPRLILFQEKLNERLLPLYGDNLFCAFSSPVPEDREFRLKEKETNLKVGYSTINEERQRDGLEKVSWGDVPYLPMNLMPIGSAEKAEKDYVEEAIDKAAKKVIDEFLAKKKKRLSEEQKAERWKDYVKRMTPHETEFRKMVIGFFNEQEKEILANMRRHPKSVSKDVIDDFWLFMLDPWIERFKNGSRPIYIKTMKDLGGRTLAELGSTVDFDIRDPRVEKYLSEKTAKFGKEVNKTTIDKLRKTLREGVKNGEGIPLLRKRVQAVFDNATRHRANTIARTEIASSSARASLEGFYQSGLPKDEWVKVWIAALDERTRPSHADAHGQRVAPDDNFVLGSGVETQGPGQSGVAEEDIMCRCDIVWEEKEK